MTETDVRKLAEEYIDEALTGQMDKSLAKEREAAVERVEAASRELLYASRESARESFAC
jgi:hypothetical protein